MQVGGCWQTYRGLAPVPAGVSGPGRLDEQVGDGHVALLSDLADTATRRVVGDGLKTIQLVGLIPNDINC